MQVPIIRICLALPFLLFTSSIWAQDKIEREVTAHDNVKLIVMAPGPDIEESLQKVYREFLPIFEQALKENTTDQSDECSLTLRIVAGVKEIGSAKTKRPFARVSAYRKSSRQEFVANFILYSYISAGPVNKEETAQFLTKQILEPAQCIEAK